MDNNQGGQQNSELERLRAELQSSREYARKAKLESLNLAQALLDWANPTSDNANNRHQGKAWAEKMVAAMKERT